MASDSRSLHAYFVAGAVQPITSKFGTINWSRT